MSYHVFSVVLKTNEMFLQLKKNYNTEELLHFVVSKLEIKLTAPEYEIFAQDDDLEKEPAMYFLAKGECTVKGECKCRRRYGARARDIR